VELLGRYSNWTSWADRVRSIDRRGPDRTEARARTRGTARRLTEDEVTELVTDYEGGATVYDLAKRFKIHRNTVSGHLHLRDIKMRGQSMTEEQGGPGHTAVSAGLVSGSDRQPPGRQWRHGLAGAACPGCADARHAWAGAVGQASS
jgi:DNA-binding CsgD family transcriptional regulator